jgi:hypothetical protein
MPPNMARHCPIVKWDGRPVASPSAEDVVHVMRRRRRRPRASVTRGRPTLSEPSRHPCFHRPARRPEPSRGAAGRTHHSRECRTFRTRLYANESVVCGGSRWSFPPDSTGDPHRPVASTASPRPATRGEAFSYLELDNADHFAVVGPDHEAWAAVARQIAEVVRPGRTGGSDCLTGVASGGAPDWRRRTRDSASLPSAAEVVCSNDGQSQRISSLVCLASPKPRSLS